MHELLGARLAVAGVAAQFERVVSATEPAWVADHRIAGTVVMPLTAYLEAALAAARQVYGADVTGLDHVEVGEPLPLPDGHERLLQVVVDDAAGQRVRVFSRDAAHDAGAMDSPRQRGSRHRTRQPAAEPLATVAPRCTLTIDVPRLLRKVRGLGADFGPRFRMMQTAASGPGEAIGDVGVHDSVLAESGKYLLHPALLDACFHVSAAAQDRLPGADDGRMYLPVAAERYRWFATPTGPVRSHARIRPPHVRGDMMVLDIRIESAEGAPVAQIDGLRCRRASRDMFRRRTDALVADWLYAPVWKVARRVADRPIAGRWLVFDEGEGRGERLAAEIARRGGSALRVIPGPGYAVCGDRAEIDPRVGGPPDAPAGRGRR